MAKSWWRSTLDVSLTAAMVVLIVSLGWTMYRDNSGASPPDAAIRIPVEPVTLEGAYVRGNPAAPVAVVVYIDYQCQACRVFDEETLPALERDYIGPGRVLLAVRPFPLASRGGAAIDEAALVQCAGRDGKSWEAHYALVAQVGASGLEKVAAVSAATGIETDTLATCVPDERPRVQHAAEDARRLGVSGTPAFLIGRLEPDGRVRVSVARHGVSNGNQWFVDLLHPVLEAASR